MDSVLGNRVATEVPHAEDRVSFSINFYFVTLHNFLDGCSNITEPDIDACRLDAFVGGFLHRLQQWLVLGVEGDRESRVDEVAVYMGAEI